MSHDSSRGPSSRCCGISANQTLPSCSNGSNRDACPDRRRSRTLLIVAAGGALLLLAQCDWAMRTAFFGASEPDRTGLGAAELEVEVVARDLEIPWEIAFLPDGDLLLTERPGRIVRLDPEGDRRAEIPVEGVRHIGEGGLMGLALHPAFRENRWIYVMLTGEDAEGELENRVERYRLDEGEISERTVIVEGIPGARFHDGGRIAFGPDGFLYVATGDAGNGDLSQDPGSLAGKILRMTDRGEPAPDNPFLGEAAGDSRVWALGLRNPQGLAWDGDGRLWNTDHGRSGLRSGLDELNRIEPGVNYGWPVIEGDEDAPSMEPPVVHSGPDVTWAPGGAAYAEGRIFFTGLRGEALYEADVEEAARAWEDAAEVEEAPEVVAHLFQDFGRLRAVTRGPDGTLYVGTSNRDGRGVVREGDDRILRIDPEAFRRGEDPGTRP